MLIVSNVGNSSKWTWDFLFEFHDHLVLKLFPILNIEDRIVKLLFGYILWFNGSITCSRRVNLQEMSLSRDVIEAIQAINSSEDPASIQAMSLVTKDIHIISFCHIPRRLNEVAHRMTKICQSFNCDVEQSKWLVESVPWCDFFFFFLACLGPSPFRFYYKFFTKKINAVRRADL